MRHVARVARGLLGWLLHPRRLWWLAATAIRLCRILLIASAFGLSQGSGLATSIHARRAHRGQRGAALYWLATATLGVTWCISALHVASGDFSGIGVGLVAGVVYLIVLVAMDWHAEYLGTGDVALDEELDAHVSYGEWSWGEPDPGTGTQADATATAVEYEAVVGES